MSTPLTGLGTVDLYVTDTPLDSQVGSSAAVSELAGPYFSGEQQLESFRPQSGLVGLFSRLDSLIEEGRVEASTEKMQSLYKMMTAIKEGKLQEVKDFIEHGGFTNEDFLRISEYALTLASEFGHAEILEILLTTYKIPEKQVVGCASWALQHGRIRAFKTIIENSNIGEVGSIRLCSALSRLSLQKIIDSNTEDKNAMLSIAVGVRRLDVVQALCRDDSITPEKKLDAFTRAVSEGQTQMIETFLRDDSIGLYHRSLALTAAVRTGQPRIARMFGKEIMKITAGLALAIFCEYALIKAWENRASLG